MKYNIQINVMTYIYQLLENMTQEKIRKYERMEELKIKMLRIKLNRLIEKYGLKHSKVIECSKELDNLILNQQIIKLNEYKGAKNECNTSNR